MLKTAIHLKRLKKKAGSSLPMVVAIGLVLVIWIMALAPMVVTQGTVSANIRSQEREYLQSRSAIEFTKGELVNMVANGSTPETFAILQNSAGQYEACTQFGSTTYSNYVKTDGTPVLDADGNLVSVSDKTLSAVCAVEKEQDSRVYDINITTYNGAEKGMTYHTTYTPPVLSQQVYPEAYKKTEALPLSDFILVDGKLGAETVWYSPLTYIEQGKSTPTYKHTSYFKAVEGGSNNDMFESYEDGFKEVLLPTSENADASNYSAVFKVTAEAEPINGEEEVTSGEIEGLISYSYAGNYSSPKYTVTPTIDGQKIKLSVTLTQGNRDYALFAYSTRQNPVSVTWHKYPENGALTFTLDKGDYYIFCYVAGHVENNKLYGDSDVVCQKVTVTTTTEQIPAKFEHKSSNYTTSPTSGKEYIIYTKNNNGTYSYLDVSGSNLAANRIDTENFDPAGNYWTVTKTTSYNTTKYTFKHSDGRYLKYESSKFTTSTQSAQLRMSGQKIQNDTNSSKRYLSFTANNFVTSSSSSATTLYFYPVEKLAASTQTTESASVTTASGSAPKLSASISDKNLTYTTKVAFDDVIAEYVDHASSQIRDIQDLSVYLSTTGSATEYSAYGVWSQDDKPYFSKLGTVSLACDYGISGRALYFMGADYAIDTNGENVYLNVDLLVIRNAIDRGNGAIYVNPYSCTDTLAFFVNGTTDSRGNVIFKEYNFYQIPAGTDLTSVTAEDASSWLVRDSSGDYASGSIVERIDGRVTSVLFPDRVISLETGFGYDYPIINFDIAYSTDEQLAHIVSGEAARWTKDGVLVDNSTESVEVNGWYVVCPFVTEIGGNVSRSANRILLKTEAESLTVSKEIRLVARYLSIDAREIAQENSRAKFLLYCLTSKENEYEAWLDFLTEWLGSIDFSSDTMQVDYERATKITYPAVAGSPQRECTIPAQICRYANGTNLFDVKQPESAKEDLRIDYSVSTINQKFDEKNDEIKIVERYMNIAGDAPDSTLDLHYSYWFIVTLDGSGTLNLFSNYISFDENVTKINIPKGSLDGYGDVIINSQESGYTSSEYLYLFTTSSAETYTGTMMYFESSVDVYKGSSKALTIDPGFYYVPSSKNGTSIFNLPNYKITTAELMQMTNYINPQDGSFSSAYVNPGFETDEPTSGGFGGGIVNEKVTSE